MLEITRTLRSSCAIASRREFVDKLADDRVLAARAFDQGGRREDIVGRVVVDFRVLLKILDGFRIGAARHQHCGRH